MLVLTYGGTFCLPLYRYTEDGERVSNITDWGLKRVNDHYRKEFGRHFEEVVGGDSISAEDVFAYTYAVLHDPVYRLDYKNDLLREFPRLPLYHDFDVTGERWDVNLLDLHINFEERGAVSAGAYRKGGGEGVRPNAQANPAGGQEERVIDNRQSDHSVGRAGIRLGV